MSDDLKDGTVYDKHVCFCGPCSAKLTELEAENARLKLEVEELEADDAGCWHCGHPGPCQNSAMLERVFQEQIADRDRLKLELGKAEAAIVHIGRYVRPSIYSPGKQVTGIIEDYFKANGEA